MITPVCLLMARGERPRTCVRLHEPDDHPSVLAPRLQAESPRCGCHAAPLYCVGDFCLGRGLGARFQARGGRYMGEAGATLAVAALPGDREEKVVEGQAQAPFRSAGLIF